MPSEEKQEERKSHHTEVHEPLPAKLQPRRDPVGIAIPREQHYLKKQKYRRPDRWCSAKPGQNVSADDGLYLKEQERGKET